MAAAWVQIQHLAPLCCVLLQEDTPLSGGDSYSSDCGKAPGLGDLSLAWGRCLVKVLSPLSFPHLPLRGLMHSDQLRSLGKKM